MWRKYVKVIQMIQNVRLFIQVLHKEMSVTTMILTT